jgi:hypothetical protein
MTMTFTCYLHRPGVVTPELRIVACASEDLLPDAILAEVGDWDACESIDVYNDADEPLFRFTNGTRVAD